MTIERRRVPWADWFRTRPLFIGGTETLPSVQGGTKDEKIKLLKRALAAVLTMTMALCTVPMTAFAAEAPAETAPVKATYWLNEPQEESTQVRVGATMLNVPTEDLENGTVIAIFQDTQGEYLAVDLNDQAALAAIDPEILCFYNRTIQMYLTRTGGNQFSIRFYVTGASTFSRLTGSAYVKEYTTSLTSLFYESGNLVTKPSGLTSDSFYSSLRSFTYTGSNAELNVGLRGGAVYLTNGQKIDLPYDSSGYLSPK